MYSCVSFLTLLFWLLTAEAVVVPDFYQINLPVASEAEALSDKQALLSRSFQALILKMTAQQEMLQAPQVVVALQSPERFIKTYTFAAQPTPTFQVLYDSNLIEGLFKSAQLPLWGKNRPLILVWCVVKKTPQSAFEIDNNPEWAAELDVLSRKWGLPLVMPALDLEEVSQVSAQDIVTGNFEILKQVAERYGAEVNLVIRLEEQSAPLPWEAHWELLVGDQKILWRQSAKTEQIILKEGVETVARNLQKRYAVTLNQSSGVVNVEVSSIKNLQEYARLLQYLKNNSSVASVRVEQVQGDRIKIQVVPKSNISDLDQALTADGHLIKKNKSTDSLVSVEFFMKTMQLPLGVHLLDDATFVSFYEGQNGLVLSALHEWMTSRSLDPYLYIWGEKGVGCTHLLQAVCNEATLKGASACYIPLAQYTEETPSMLEGLENCDFICIDDIDAIAKNAEWEEALFHLFNRARSAARHLLIAGNAAPCHLNMQLPDLKSRLGWGTTFQVHALEDEQKLTALQLRAKARGLVLSDEVGRFLLRRCDRDMKALYQTLGQLDAASLSAQRRLTIPFIKQVLSI
jgi:DnaA family protein